MRLLLASLVLTAASLVTASAAAQTPAATSTPAPPWMRPWTTTLDAPPVLPDVGVAAQDLPPAPPWPRRWPTVRVPARRLVRPMGVSAPSTRTTASEGETADPASGHHFQLPTARLLRYGDLMGHYVSHLGWAGLRYGLTRRVDVGVGVPYYFAGISLDARVAFVQNQNFAAAWWGYVTVPFRPEGDLPTSNLGFTWAYAGMGWLTGPLVSVWKGRVGAHAGLHVGQRTGLGGLWLVSHLTVDVRLVPGVKLIAQGLMFYELSLEQGDRARALLGNDERRFIPYALGGVRFHTRRFAADVGVLAPLAEAAPLWSDRMAVLPWMSIAHLF